MFRHWMMLTAWFRNVVLRRKADQDLDSELASYVAMLAEQKTRSGLAPDEAYRAARIEFGSLDVVKEEVRAIRAGHSAEQWLKDLRHAIRGLKRTPGFALSAIATLAFGMGATTAVFSVVDAVLLRPLPLNDPGRIVCVWEDNRESGWPQETPAPANYADWRGRNRVFSDMGALKGMTIAITGHGSPEQVEASAITANLFPLLGARPVLGRHIAVEEDRSGASKVALISHSLWLRRFGGDNSAIGKELSFDRVPHRIIGVMPPGFALPDRSDVWVPIAFTDDQLAARDNHYLRVFARMKDGVTVEEAQRDMNRVASELAFEYPATNSKHASVMNLKDQIVGRSRVGLWVLLGGSACLLLLTGINVSSLLVARGISRSQELALCVALGAGWRQIVRRSVAEIAVLNLAATAAGWVLANAGLSFLDRLVPTELGEWVRPSLDLRVAAFSAFAGIAVTLAASLLPATAASRVDPSKLLHQAGRSNVGGHSRTRRLLVVGQVAISVVLCIGAGLLIRTLSNLWNVELGFNPYGVLTARTSLPLSPESPYRDFARREAFYRQVIEKVTAVPGVTGAGYTTFLPLTNAGGTSYFLVEGEAPPARPGQNDANIRIVTPGYLRVMGIRLLSGRDLNEADGPTSMPVALINETMAKGFWRERDPAGSRFRENRPGAPWITIVGVVADVRQNGVEQPGRPEMYFPAAQPFAGGGWTAPRDLAVRVQGDPMQYAAALRTAVWEVDRQQPVSAVMPLRQLVEAEFAFRDTMMRLLGAFATLALLVASLGLYGSVSYSVGQRNREIGLRVALGASPKRIFVQILGGALGTVVAGTATGVLASWPLSWFSASMFYGVRWFDPATVVGSSAVLVGCGLLAALGPSLRAAFVDPISTLKLE